MFEAEVKASIIKVATIEQHLSSEKAERKKLEIEFNSYKDKQALEYLVYSYI